jgi:oligoendopeptidase F
MSAKSFVQSRWSLTDLYPSPESQALQDAIHILEEKVTTFEAVRPQLQEELDGEIFLGFVRQLEDLSKIAYELAGFAALSFAEDTQNPVAQNLMGKMDQLAADVENRTLFFTLWWKNLSPELAEILMADSGDYRYWLEEMRHFKEHSLSEPEEKIVNLKNVTGMNALRTLYDAITNRYIFKLEVNGEVKELTRGEIMSYVRQHDPDLRARAYQELYRVYAADGSILGQLYQTLVRDWRNEQITLRGFSNPMAARNLINDIPDQVVNTLLEAAQRNAGIFQRFFQLKARWLGVERLRRCDLYAPVAKSDKAYPFQQAAEMVLDSFWQFAPRLSELARRVLAENHLDSEVRKGKRGGAFCDTILPSRTPWVLVNYQGKADDVATLAHELGHAIHSMLAAEHSLFTFHACLPLAETASTFGEMMLVERLLKEESDEAVRRDILFRQVDDAYATIMRQSYFALFERKAHEMVLQGASVDELSAAYLENLKEQFGTAIDLSDEFKWEWVSIPHIYHVPFYVYAYAFGQLLVFSLYKQFKAEGESFKPRYLKILSTGGSKAPVALLADAGINVYDPAFWQGGFDVIRGMVEQLEALPIPKK